MIEREGGNEASQNFFTMIVEEVRFDTVFDPVLVNEVNVLKAQFAGRALCLESSMEQVCLCFRIGEERTEDGVADVRLAKLCRHWRICLV